MNPPCNLPLRSLFPLPTLLPTHPPPKVGAALSSVSPSSLQLVELLWLTVSQAKAALALEAALCLQALGVQQKTADEKAARVAAEKKKREEEMAAKLQAEGKKVGGKNKKEKKGGKKDKGNKEAMVLGKGTTALRAYLQSGPFVQVASNEEFLEACKGVEKLLDPACPGIAAVLT